MSQKVLTKEELERKYPTEEVFVVDKRKYENIQDGLHLNEDIYNLFENFINEGYFVKRKNAEYNPEYLQLIPYVVIKHEDKYFTAKRIGGDVRSIGKITVGMGGHINPEDYDRLNPKEIFNNCIYRELSAEELHIDLSKTTKISFKGLIRYTNPEDLLSQDHLGLLYILETNDSNVTIKETDKLKGKFLTVSEIIADIDKSESWSRIIIERLLK